MNNELPKLETESDEKITEKESINKEIEMEIDTENKSNRNLLDYYTIYDKQNKKDKHVRYDSLMTLGNNIPATYNLTKDLEKVYHLSYNKDNNKPYLFDYNINSYIEIDNRILQEFLAANEGIRLRTTDTENLIKSIIARINNNYNYIEFNNKLYNLKTFELEDKTIKKVIHGKERETVQPRPFITPKRINHNILDKKDTNFDPENSIVYQTLKQILGTEENIKDFKQRLGVSIFNKGKEITIYYGKSGDNGKSGLIYIRKLVLGALAKNTKPSQLNSDYIQNLLNNIHELQFDETDEESYKGTEDYLKKITGGGVEEETRQIKTSKIIKTRLNSHVVIATNTLPDFNLNDTALFNRISIIELTNKFTHDISKVNDKTVFQINLNYKDELAEDKEGLEHLIYDSIKEYNLMIAKNETLVNKRGVEYCRAYYLGNDHLLNFLNIYTEKVDYETENTTATEITNNYKQYLKDNEIELIIDDIKLSKDMGMKLNKLYGKTNIIRDKGTRPVEYKNIKCNYTTENQLGFFVHSELEDYKIYNENYRKIFNLIKKGYNTFEQLKQQEKHHDNITNAINWLRDNGYIEKRTILKIN